MNIDRHETNIDIIDDAFWWYLILKHFRPYSHDCRCLRMTYNVAMSACERWREVFLLWEEMRWGDKRRLPEFVAGLSRWWDCSSVVGDSLGKQRTNGIPGGSMNHHRIFIWCIKICTYVSIHLHTIIFIATYKYIHIQITNVSMTSVVKLNTFLPPTFARCDATASIFSASDSPETPRNSDASGRRMWQQTSLASMSCWAWELRGVVANCAWKRCCLGEGEGWSTCRIDPNKARFAVSRFSLCCWTASCLPVGKFWTKLAWAWKPLGFDILGFETSFLFLSCQYMTVRHLVLVLQFQLQISLLTRRLERTAVTFEYLLRIQQPGGAGLALKPQENPTKTWTG